MIRNSSLQDAVNLNTDTCRFNVLPQILLHFILRFTGILVPLFGFQPDSAQFIYEPPQQDELANLQSGEGMFDDEKNPQDKHYTMHNIL